MLDVEVLGWCGYTWSVVVRPVGCTTKFSESLWRRLMVEKLTFNLRATALVDIPSVSMPIACSLKAFIVASLRHTCAIIMLSNQHLDMPHL